MYEHGVQYYPRALLTGSPWILRMDPRNLGAGYARYTLKKSRFQPHPPPTPIPFPTLSDSSNDALLLDDSIGNFSLSSVSNEDLMVSSQPSNNGWEITQHQPTWSQLEALSPNAEIIVPSSIPESDSPLNMGPHLWYSDEELIYSPSSEPAPDWIPKTPLGMTCCCDTPYPESTNCLFLSTPGNETLLSHLFLKSITDRPELGSHGGSFNLFQRHILNHLASGGTITTSKRQSSWMILMDACYHLVISSELLTDTQRMSKSKVPQFPSLQLDSSLQRTSTPHTGGHSRSLEVMAETLFGVALLEYSSTQLTMTRSNAPPLTLELLKCSD